MTVLLAKLLHRAEMVILDKDPEERYQPRTERVEQPVVAERATDDAEAHELA